MAPAELLRILRVAFVRRTDREKMSFAIRYCKECHGIMADCRAELPINSARRSSW